MAQNIGVKNGAKVRYIRYMMIDASSRVIVFSGFIFSGEYLCGISL